MNKKQKTQLIEQGYKLFDNNKIVRKLAPYLLFNWHTKASLSQKYKKSKSKTNPTVLKYVDLLEELGYLNKKMIRPVKRRKGRNGKYHTHYSAESEHFRLNEKPYLEWLEKEMLMQRLDHQKYKAHWINIFSERSMKRIFKRSKTAAITYRFFWKIYGGLLIKGLSRNLNKMRFGERLYWKISDWVGPVKQRRFVCWPQIMININSWFFRREIAARDKAMRDAYMNRILE